jgi:predicted  nucleic acid-binding Zn-ribbon protein
MEELDKLNVQLPEHEQALRKAREDFARFQTDYEPRLKSYRDQFEQNRAELAAKEELLPGGIREAYLRLVTAQGDDALAAVDNRTCTACHTEITVQHRNDLLSGRLVTCKSCGRMLYPKDEPVPQPQ